MVFVPRTVQNIRSGTEKEQWKLDERILIQFIKSVTVYFLKEQYMWFSGGNGLRKKR